MLKLQLYSLIIMNYLALISQETGHLFY